MKTFLVTGAAGFIGSTVAKHLISDGNSVVTVDNLSTGKENAIPDGCTLIKGNDYDETVLEQLYHYNFDSIIHIAGQSSGEVSFENPVYDLQTNTQTTLMLLDYARKTNCKEFIFASSMSTYGDHENPYVNEQTVSVPKSFYAVGKLASENYMRIYSSIYGIRCTALRFFNVYGIGQNMDNLKQGMASIYLALALKNRHITVKGSKSRFRDFVYIDDVVDSVIKSTNRKNGNQFEAYNVSNARKIHVYEIIDVIEKTLPFKVTHEYIEGTSGDQMGIYSDYSKIEKDLEWKGTIRFEEGMKKMIEWAINLF
jgi:UDP-glucose 4-epimerase